MPMVSAHGARLSALGRPRKTLTIEAKDLSGPDAAKQSIINAQGATRRRRADRGLAE
ncbi:hypothetical protein BCAR13_170017 [Paraburkholderia caribensis]|nr:hypothetical protein BCAR13_170017 [Paraburkholderia caribensis]